MGDSSCKWTAVVSGDGPATDSGCCKERKLFLWLWAGSG